MLFFSDYGVRSSGLGGESVIGFDACTQQSLRTTHIDHRDHLSPHFIRMFVRMCCVSIYWHVFNLLACCNICLYLIYDSKAIMCGAQNAIIEHKYYTFVHRTTPANKLRTDYARLNDMCVAQIVAYVCVIIDCVWWVNRLIRMIRFRGVIYCI